MFGEVRDVPWAKSLLLCPECLPESSRSSGEAASWGEALYCPRAVGISRCKFRNAHQLLFLFSL